MFKGRRYLSVDGKDGADGHEAVDVGGAVERIKTHDVFALEVKKMAEVILGFRCLKGVTKDTILVNRKLVKLPLTHKSNKLFNKAQAFRLVPHL